ncbi:hypothetical protein F5X99DRAFT_65598 [Biscogniauxia marginata]|nr:hypothetical protein F5X99DRAFT_65598 [Biscogniauxia marginata]
MGKGLDELIESLLTEIAFSGSRGCRVSNLLAAINAFYKDDKGTGGNPDVTPQGKGPDLEHDNLVVASKVWCWLVARPDVSVGVDRKFNHLSLEAVLALPEDEDDQTPSDPASGSSGVPANTPEAGQSGPSRGPRKLGKGLENARPRLHISEERQWRILTGHGPDFKRVPTFEWRALVDIASVKDKGILQGDLVRLTGQDKRSLPTRTDALAKKGYIIKQPILLRGCRSSKLWLAQFAEKAKQDADRDGLQFDKVDLSKEALTKDLNPVSFSKMWNGERLDYLAIAQAFVAVVKAWGLIRYCDARAKLDVEERVAQMRALAKTSRWLTSIGSVTFVAARFSHNHRLFKDCVKFLREPTPAEWRIFRTTPKAKLNVPSYRVGARGKASRAKHEALTKSRSKSKEKHTSGKRTPLEPSVKDEVIPSLWAPQKPITNTVFEIIKRSGPAGSSNASIGRQTLGYSYRKYTAALNAALSFPSSQPPYLEHLAVTSKLTRVGKAMTYHFFAKSEIASLSLAPTEDNAQTQEADIARRALGEESLTTPPIEKKTPAFSRPIESKFAPSPSTSLSRLSRAIPSINTTQTREQNSTRKRKRTSNDNPAEYPTAKRRGRPPKARVQEPEKPVVTEGLPMDSQINTRLRTTSGVMTGELQMDKATSPMNEQEFPAEPSPQQDPTPEPPQPRPPGVYRELKPPLEYGLKRKGRPRRSCIVVFRSDRLKDPSFLGVTQTEPDGEVAETSTPGDNTAHSVIGPTNMTGIEDALLSTVAESTPAKQSTAIQRRKSRKSKARSFKCDECGNSWRNSNGLEYHLNKSQTTCNPNFVPPPPEPIVLQPDLKQRDARPLASSSPRRRQKAKGSGDDDVPSIPLSKTPPTRVRPVRSQITGTISEGTPKPASTRGAILLQDLQAYDITDRGLQRADQAPSQFHGIYSSDTKPPGSVQPQSREQLEHCKESLRQRKYAGSHQGTNALQHPSTEIPNNNGPSTSLREGTSVNSKTGVHHNYGIRDLEDQNLLSPLSATNTQPDSSATVLARQSAGKYVSFPMVTGTATSVNTAQNSLTSPNQTHKRTLPNADPVSRYKSLLSSRGLSSENVQRDHRSDVNSTASFGNSKTSKVSLGAQRRERTSKIIGYLLDQNEGVFPGQKSLYMTLISIWTREYSDLAPPDWKMCHSVVSKMDKTGLLEQQHFGFLDGQGQLQDCTILVKPRKDGSQPADLSTDTKVAAIKEKMREMFPEPYIPEAFSLSEKELELFDALALRHRGPQQDEKTSTQAQKVNKAQKIEVLQYPMPVIVDMPTNANTSKRPHEDEDGQNSKPSKKTCVDVLGIGKTQSNRKYRKKPESQFRDAGKLAIYIWNQRQNHASNWNQMPACLQDPTTGTWSLKPETNYLPKSRIKTILSSVKSTREHDAYLRQQPSMRQKEAPRKRYNIDRFIELSTSTSFPFEDAESEDDDEDTVMEYAQKTGAADDNANTNSQDIGVRFSQLQPVRDTSHGSWPRLTTEFFDSHVQGFTMVGSMPSSQWFQKENLPRSVDDVPRTARALPLSSWADPLYGKFMRDLTRIETWERSVEGTQILSHGSVAPEYFFLSLRSDESKANMKPSAVEWPSTTQYTAENMPDDIKNASTEDEDFGLPSPALRSTRAKDSLPENQVKRTRTNRLLQDVKAKSGMNDGYKTRILTSIPRQPRGRSTHPRPINGETELIAAFVVFRTLIGGVDQTVDLGLIMKYFPEMSLSALRKFWPKVTRERKTYVDALTSKFQSAFLEAYERGDVPPLDYDNLADYDWRSLITWTAKLETHDDVILPVSLQALNEAYLLEDPIDEVVNWREIWFSQASVYNRIEAAAGESISIPVPSTRDDEAILRIARSWVRSLCCTSIKGVDSPEKIRAKLLRLANGDESSTNRLLGRVLSKLRSEKLVVRSKGKIMGQSFRLHAQFVKQLEKLSRAEKFTQATAFKTQLDENFRADKEFLLPYASDDGTIMAVINLQTCGRVRVEAVDIPNIPFGFEPGNYEGRLFPKSYYHFQVRLAPTQTYTYDEDMPLLREARGAEPPAEGPRGEIPIWVDFFGGLDRARWSEYLSMMAFALATKGPLTPASAAVLLRPVVEEFEARLIMDWLDKLGLLQRVGSGRGATMAEWWWLAIGRLVDFEKGKSRA